MQQEEIKQAEQAQEIDILPEFQRVPSNSVYYNIPKGVEKISKKLIIKLLIACLIGLIFLLCEVVGGILAQSLAILSDAAHMFSDFFGFIISMVSIWLATRPATGKLTFGYLRAEVIGALCSIFLIWGLTVVLVYEATERIINKAKVDNPLIMLIVAGIGLVSNLCMAKVLHSTPGHKHFGHSHDHGHGHSHGDELDHDHPQQAGQDHDHDHDHDKDHDHDHDEKHDHDHDEEKDHKEKDKKDHKHEHKEKHEHKDKKDKNKAKEENEKVEKMSELQDQSSNKVPLLQDQQEDLGEQKIQVNVDVEVKNENQVKIENPNHDNENQPVQAQNQEQIEPQKEQKVEIEESSEKKQQENEISKADSHNEEDSHVHAHEDEHGHKHAGGEGENFNLRAAFIHVIGDFIQSIGVLIAACLIYFFGRDDGKYNYWHLADPLCTYIFSILVVFTTSRITKDCINVLMEGIPMNLDIENFKMAISVIAHVLEVHDLHIWSLSHGKPSLSVHLQAPKEYHKQVIKEATLLCRKFGIYHSTIQIEDSYEVKNSKSYIKCDQNIHV